LDDSYYPRGRILYDQEEDMYHALMDGCIPEEAPARVLKEFNLTGGLICSTPWIRIVRGADVNAADSTGMTPLMYAAIFGKAGTFSVNIGATGQGNMASAPNFEGAPDLVTILLASGADVSLKSSEGKTALTYATERKQKEVVDILLKHGAK
jgi:ankyrin repeat protein